MKIDFEKLEPPADEVVKQVKRAVKQENAGLGCAIVVGSGLLMWWVLWMAWK